MRKLTTPLIALLALFCFTFFSACSQQKGAPSEDRPNQPNMSQQTEPTQEQQLTGDQQFLTEAAQDGRAEVEVAQLAASKASNPGVKRFAQRLVADHTKANQQLESLPQASQIQSSSLPEEKRSAVDQLSKASGKEFDRAFVDQAVQDHESAVARFQEAASTAKDPQIKQFAAQNVPVLQRHLEMAKQLQSRLSGGERSQQ
jgi:putative membrane protein